MSDEYLNLVSNLPAKARVQIKCTFDEITPNKYIGASYTTELVSPTIVSLSAKPIGKYSRFSEVTRGIKIL